MIRNATHDDIPTMLELGEAMHAESRYARYKWSVPKVRELIECLIDSDDGLALVAERDGEIIGGFLGVISERYFSDEKVANDFAMFVSQDKRGGIVAAQLIRAFTAWSTKNGAEPELGITTNVNLEATSRLLEMVGFKQSGNLFVFEGAQ